MRSHPKHGSAHPMAILAAVLVVVLIAAALFYYNRYLEQRQRLQQAIAHARQLEQELASQREAIERLKTLVGHSAARDSSALEAAVRRDLQSAQLGTGDPLPPESYVDALARLGERLVHQGTLLDTLEADVARLRRQFADRQQSADAAIDVADQARQRAEADLAEYQSQFDRILSDKDAVIGRFQDRAHELQTQVDHLSTENHEQRQRLVGQIERLQDWVRLLKQKDQPPDDVTPEPDGEIVRVASSGDRVYLNLGARDGVKRDLTFSVYDNRLEAGRPKAKIQLVRVIDDRLSEARVIEAASIADPILTGDKVVNLIWQRGHKQHVALAGFFDLDGDGRDDRRLVHKLIENAGAILDAEALPDGSVRGTLTVDTNYLIVGAEPPGGQPDALVGMSQVIQSADEYSVPRINLERFLERTGMRWSS